MRRHLVKRHGKSASGQIAKGRSPLGAKGARTSALVCALMALAALALCMPAVAWADARAAEEDALWQPRASVSVEEAADGAVLVTATGENGGLTALRGADLELTVPEGLRVVEGEVRASAETVEPGGTLRVQATLSLADAGGAGGGAVKPLAGTGEGSVGALLAAAAVALAAFAAFALRRSRRARNAGRDAFCVLLAAGLAAGLAPASLAFAADGDAVEGAALEGTAHATAVLQGSSFELTARMRATSADPLPEDACSTVAWLSTEAHVAQGADRAHVSLVSDTPFAEDLSAASFSLEDAFSGCAVASANRASDTQVDLVIEGRVADDGSDGAVRAAADAFSEDVLCCMGVVPAEVPEARLLDADAGAGEGYNAADGLFALPLTIGSAEFLAGVSADRFSLPADGGVRVTAVEAVEGAHEARITLEVPGDDAEARFERLDAALTAGGVRIDAAAVNCGEMVAVSDDVARGQEAGYETTALEYVDATLFAVARVIDATVEADGSVELSCEASVEDADGGKVDLRSAGAFVDVARVPLAAVEDAAGADAACESASVVDAGTLAVTGPSTFVFRTTLPADQADVLEVLVDDADGCGAPANHIPDQAELADWALSLCQVSVGGGAVSNRWGIPVGAASAPLLTCSEAQVMARTPDLTPAEKAEKSLEAVQEALNAVGSFVRAFEGDADGCFQGAGSVFGCVAKLVGVMSPPVYTLADVMTASTPSVEHARHRTRRGGARPAAGVVRVAQLLPPGFKRPFGLCECSGRGERDVPSGVRRCGEGGRGRLGRIVLPDERGRPGGVAHVGAGDVAVLGPPQPHDARVDEGFGRAHRGELGHIGVERVRAVLRLRGHLLQLGAADLRRAPAIPCLCGQAYLVGYMASMCELNVAIADAAPGSAELQAAKAAQGRLSPRPKPCPRRSRAKWTRRARS